MKKDIPGADVENNADCSGDFLMTKRLPFEVVFSGAQIVAHQTPQKIRERNKHDPDCFSEERLQNTVPTVAPERKHTNMRECFFNFFRCAFSGSWKCLISFASPTPI